MVLCYGTFENVNLWQQKEECIILLKIVELELKFFVLGIYTVTEKLVSSSFGRVLDGPSKVQTKTFDPAINHKPAIALHTKNPKANLINNFFNVVHFPTHILRQRISIDSKNNKESKLPSCPYCFSQILV